MKKFMAFGFVAFATIVLIASVPAFSADKDKEWAVGASLYGYYPLGSDPIDLDLQEPLGPDNLIQVYFDFRDKGESICVPFFNIGQLPYKNNFYDILAPIDLHTGDIVDFAVAEFGYPSFQIEDSGTVDPHCLGFIGYVIAKETYDTEGYAVALGNRTFVEDAKSSFNPMLLATIDVTTPVVDWASLSAGFFWLSGQAEADLYKNFAGIDFKAGVSPVENWKGKCWPDSDYYYGLWAGLGLANASYDMDFDVYGIPIGITFRHDLGFIKPGSFMERIVVSAFPFVMPYESDVNESVSPWIAAMPYHTAVLSDGASWKTSEWGVAGGVAVNVMVNVLKTANSSLEVGPSFLYIGGVTLHSDGPMGNTPVDILGGGIGLNYRFNLGPKIQESAVTPVEPTIEPKLEPMSLK